MPIKFRHIECQQSLEIVPFKCQQSLNILNVNKVYIYWMSTKFRHIECRQSLDTLSVKNYIMCCDLAGSVGSWQH